MRYIKTYESVTNNELYTFRIFNDKEHKFFTVEYWLFDQFFYYEDEKSGFNEVKEWIKEKLDTLPMENRVGTKDIHNPKDQLTYTIKMKDFTHDKDEPAYDVEFYWKNKFIGHDDGFRKDDRLYHGGVFSTKKPNAFSSAIQFIKDVLDKLPSNYDVLIKSSQFDL